MASRTGPVRLSERSNSVTRANDGAVAASAIATAASRSSRPLIAGRSRPGTRARSPAIGIRAKAPATPAVRGPALTAQRITPAAPAIIRTWPCSRSGWSAGLTSQATPTALKSQGTAESSTGFSPIGKREARKRATSMLAAMVTPRRVSPSKLEGTRWAGRESNRMAASGPIAQAVALGSTSRASDHAAATAIANVPACRRRPALP